MDKDHITSLCVCPSGSLLVLTNNTLNTYTPQQDLQESPSSTIGLGSHHVLPCECLLQVATRTPERHDGALPNLLIASNDCISSWSTHPSSDFTRHVLISKVQLELFPKDQNSLQMALSPCQSALALWSSSRLSILAIANNGGLATCA